MRDFDKAIALVVSSCLAVSGILTAASLAHSPTLTSAELSAATRSALNDAIEAAIRTGGLRDSESFLSGRISARLASIGYPGAIVKIVRSNDFNKLAAFYFVVVAGWISAEFNLAGARDPLLAIRLGMDVRWLEEPDHPYRWHGSSSTMSRCLTNHYFHVAADAPDFFARLENKTEDPYHHGAETFLVVNGRIAVDHLLLGRGEDMDDAHLALYGLG